jgi:c-di-GMP-binding flagellar brake protein YcgR
MALQPLRKDDLQLGKPVPYSIFDKDRVLLLGEGCVIESDTVLNTLREQGMFSSQDKQPSASQGVLFRPSLGSAPPAANESTERRGPSGDDLPLARATSTVGEESLVNFLETNLRSGDPMQLRFADGTADRFPVRLIGAVDRRSLLITHPQAHGRMIFLKDGQQVRLKALRGKHAYAFEASVLKCQLTPYPYVHLDYPTQVRATSVRKAYRVALNGVASIGRRGERGRIACNMKDVSIAGTLVQVPRQLAQVGAEIELVFRLQVDEQPVTFTLPGLIRNAREAEEGGSQYVACGVEFVDMPREQKQALQLFIYETLLAEA